MSDQGKLLKFFCELLKKAAGKIKNPEVKKDIEKCEEALQKTIEASNRADNEIKDDAEKKKSGLEEVRKRIEDDLRHFGRYISFIADNKFDESKGFFMNHDSNKNVKILEEIERSGFEHNRIVKFVKDNEELVRQVCLFTTDEDFKKLENDIKEFVENLSKYVEIAERLIRGRKSPEHNQTELQKKEYAQQMNECSENAAKAFEHVSRKMMIIVEEFEKAIQKIGNS